MTFCSLGETKGMDIKMEKVKTNLNSEVIKPKANREYFIDEIISCINWHGVLKIEQTTYKGSDLFLITDENQDSNAVAYFQHKNLNNESLRFSIKKEYLEKLETYAKTYDLTPMIATVYIIDGVNYFCYLKLNEIQTKTEGVCLYKDSNGHVVLKVTDKHLERAKLKTLTKENIGKELFDIIDSRLN